MKLKNFIKYFFFNLFEKFNIHIIKAHFYSIIPSTTEINQTIKSNLQNGLDRVFDNYDISHLNNLLKFSNNHASVIDKISNFKKKNGYFENLDAIFYELIIKKYKPNKIIEIGAGYSTLISGHFAESNGLELIVIEPFPKTFLKKIKYKKFFEKKLQDINFDIFKCLKKNDLLFIDSSHAYKYGSDVYYLFNSILPNLNKGVIIHIHDIFLPKDYPIKWLKKYKLFWNEQYILNNFLLFNNDFEILFPLQFLFINNLSKLDQLNNFYKWSYDLDSTGPGSFWIRKK